MFSGRLTKNLTGLRNLTRLPTSSDNFSNSARMPALVFSLDTLSTPEMLGKIKGRQAANPSMVAATPAATAVETEEPGWHTSGFGCVSLRRRGMAPPNVAKATA